MRNLLRLSLVTISKKTKPLNLLKDNGITTNENIVEIGQSLSGLLMLVGATGATITLMICAIEFMVTRNNPEKLNEFKEIVMFKFMLVVLLFSFTFLCGVVKAAADLMIGKIG